MSSFGWIILLTALLTLVGSAALLFVTLKYYWGERGTPPATGEQRRAKWQAERALRAKQIEYVERHPWQPRNPNFWDNTKRPT